MRAIALCLLAWTSNIVLGDDTFESWLQFQAAKPLSKTLDLRVAKALGSRGYDQVRITVISEGPANLELKRVGSDEISNFSIIEPFRYRWTHAYDLGSRNRKCSDSSIIEDKIVAFDANCLAACNAEEKCKYYTWYASERRCQLADASCELEWSLFTTATYENFGLRFMHSEIVQVEPGTENKFEVAGQEFSVIIPRHDGLVSGVVWADPCFSERWIPCLYSWLWNAFERSYTMLNALAEDPNMHFFEILGDNFYDQDGRLTKALFDRFSLKAKSKVLHAVAGNHDFWITGGPPGDRYFDQYGHGHMQFYAQDTLSAFESKTLFDYSIDPDKASFDVFRNKHRNFLWWHNLGPLGFIGYTGAGPKNETLQDMKKACSFFKKTAPKAILVLGHWNEPGDGASVGMDAPAIRDSLNQIDGCNIDDRIIFIDGHEHCNRQQNSHGFTIGAHGMIDTKCDSESGFGYVEASPSRLRMWYFEESTILSSNYHAIIDCLRKTKSIQSCTHLAKLWLDLDLNRYPSLRESLT